jgi:predicted nucleic acid-binding protein
MALTVLDAGVLIGFLDSTDGHHVTAVAALAGLRQAGEKGVIPASAYAELLVQPFRRGGGAVKVVDDALDALGLAVEPITRSTARTAAQLRARHPALRLPDALIVATARTLKASRLITTDAGWPRFSGLKVDVL